MRPSNDSSYPHSRQTTFTFLPSFLFLSLSHRNSYPITFLLIPRINIPMGALFEALFRFPWDVSGTRILDEYFPGYPPSKSTPIRSALVLVYPPCHRLYVTSDPIVLQSLSYSDTDVYIDMDLSTTEILSKKIESTISTKKWSNVGIIVIITDDWQ